jgi:hypothetical protein
MVSVGPVHGCLVPWTWAETSWWWEVLHLMADRKQRMGTRMGHTPTDGLPPPRPHLLWFLESLKIAPPPEDQALNT